MYELKVVRERRTGYGRERRVKTSGDVYQAFRAQLTLPFNKLTP